jgi:hypothetical protein
MDPSIYRKKWHKLRDGKTDPNELQQLARQVAFSFVDKHFQSGTYVADYVDMLCEMATFHADDDRNSIASSALFEVIVEKLCDDFEDLPVEVYSRVMCQVISYCRAVPAGKSLDAQLTGFGITSFDPLYKRAVSLHRREYRHDKSKPPRRIILLSRVTIGADVAILSVMIQRLRRLFPDADLVIIGNQKLHGLFGGHPDIRIRELSYARHGGLFERFAGWHAALDILREESAGVGKGGLLVIDPDSRISQLGVLPLTYADDYLFFHTRDHLLTANGRCMAQWTNDWMNAVFDVSESAHPRVGIPPGLREAAGTERDIAEAVSREAEYLFDWPYDFKYYYRRTDRLIDNQEFSNPKILQNLVRLMGERSIMLGVLKNRLVSDVSVTIGKENRIRELEDFAIVTQRFRTADCDGLLGVLGPTRMSYRLVFALLDRTAEELQHIHIVEE